MQIEHRQHQDQGWTQVTGTVTAAPPDAPLRHLSKKSNEIFQLLVLHYCIKQVKERGKKELHQTTILHCLSNLLLKVICSKCRVTPCSLHVSLKVFALNLRLECTYLNNKLQKINNFTLKHNSISGIIHFWTNGSLTHK